MKSQMLDWTHYKHVREETVIFRWWQGNIKKSPYGLINTFVMFLLLWILRPKRSRVHTHDARAVTSFLKSLCTAAIPVCYIILLTGHNLGYRYPPAEQPWFHPNSFQLWCEPAFLGSDPEATLKPLEHLAAALLTDSSLQTALNLQPRHLLKPKTSYPNSFCVCLLRGGDGHSWKLMY